MPRRKTRIRPRRASKLAAAAAGAALLAGCGVRPEQPVLDRFFAESRLRDLTALQTFSAVVFEPRTDGIVRTFEIVRVSAVSGPTERVTVTADVAMPDGTTRGETIEVTLEHVGDDWRVTAFTAPASPAPPPAR